MSLKHSATLERSAPNCTVSSTESPVRLTPQQAADLEARRAHSIIAERIAKINRGEKVREQ